MIIYDNDCRQFFIFLVENKQQMEKKLKIYHSYTN